MDGEDSPLVFAIGRVDPLEGATLRISAFDDVPAFEAAVEREAPDVVVVEHDPPRLDGLSALESVLAATEGVPSLLWTDPPDGEVAAAATRLGVTEYATTSGEPSLAARVRDVAGAAADDDAASPPGLVQAIERIDDGLVAIDDDWHLRYANGRAESLLGLSSGGRDGEDVRERLPPSIRAPLERAARTGTPVSFEQSFESPDRWLLVSVHPDEDGLSVSLRDTSDERRYRRSLSTLLETATELMVAETEEAVARITVDAAAEIVGFELNGVRRYDPATGRLELLCSTSEAEAELSAREWVTPGEDLQGKAYAAGETIVVEDPEEGPEGRYSGVRAAAAVPLGEYGTLTVGSTEPGGIDGVDRDLLELLGLSAETALARAAREESLREYRAVHETVDQMVYTLDETGHISLLTSPMARRFGYERSELVGEHIGTLLPPEDVRRGERLIRELLSAPPGTSRTYETVVHPRDGEPFPVEVDVSLYRQDGQFRGSVGVVRDVSELHRTRAQLADERDRFAFLFEQLPDAVVEAEFVDGEPVVRAVNGAFEDVFGYDAETVVGEPLNRFVVPSGEDTEAARIDERSRQGEVIREEVRRQTATGTREFLFTGVPYDTDGERVRGFAIYTDITAQRDRERRLQVLYRVLRHNLRNDMNVVAGNAADLRAALEEADSDLADLADAIHERAVGVVDISRKAGDIQRAMDTEAVPYGVDLSRVVRQAVARVERRYPDADVRVDVPALPVFSTGGLVRAVENVVENAVVHTEDAEPTVRVSLGTGAPSGAVDLRVADDGPGIPAREKAVLSDADEITQLQHSRGLGLWTARWVIEASGGELRFEDDGDGAVVVFRLKVAEGGTEVG
jgi:PAS domain S-box-containing protein